MTALVTALIMTFLTGGSAKTSPPENPDDAIIIAFVDLDGDGLNDNIADVDYDGVPDFGVAVPSPEPSASMPGVIDLLSVVGTEAPGKVEYLSKLERFRSLEFCARALVRGRGGFGSGDEFGPGHDIGQGALSGNCAGGVCH
ncbi:MAG: hypothetical protein AB1744_03465 [Candidatus Zixiibacteriota bacterium]